MRGARVWGWGGASRAWRGVVSRWTRLPRRRARSRQTGAACATVFVAAPPANQCLTKTDEEWAAMGCAVEDAGPRGGATVTVAFMGTIDLAPGWRGTCTINCNSPPDFDLTAPVPEQLYCANPNDVSEADLDLPVGADGYMAQTHSSPGTAGFTGFTIQCGNGFFLNADAANTHATGEDLAAKRDQCCTACTPVANAAPDPTDVTCTSALNSAVSECAAGFYVGPPDGDGSHVPGLRSGR